MKKIKVNPNNWYSLKKLINDELTDPGFKKEWDHGEADYQLGLQLIQARIDGKISQRTLAKKASTTQAVISRIESRKVSPSLQLASRIANALGKTLEIRFV